MALALIGALPLLASCSAAQDYRGYEVHTVIYEYTDPNREGRERLALQQAQDECYLSGDMYAQPAGPPKIVSEGGGNFRATQSFYCIGIRGED